VAALVDTNVLVYRFDPRFPEKQERATEVLRRGIVEDSLRLPHQALVEFVAAVSRPIASGPPLVASGREVSIRQEVLLAHVVVI
jgi:predicted nucleic acid-binding protein